MQLKHAVNKREREMVIMWPVEHQIGGSSVKKLKPLAMVVKVETEYLANVK
jgi:hypothetical protein